MPLLEVKDLHVELQTQRGPAEAVRGIGFTLERGETLGIVGESGCGKSITVQSLMGLLPATAKVSGSIRFDGTELVGLGEKAMCQIRGNRIGMIFQEPMTALNPVHTIARQVGEPGPATRPGGNRWPRARCHDEIARTKVEVARDQLLSAAERIDNGFGRAEHPVHRKGITTRRKMEKGRRVKFPRPVRKKSRYLSVSVVTGDRHVVRLAPFHRQSVVRSAV